MATAYITTPLPGTYGAVSEEEASSEHSEALSSDRKSVVEGKSVDLGCRRIIKKNKTKTKVSMITNGENS